MKPSPQSSITAVTGFAHLTDLPCYELQCANARVIVSLYGGHVLSYQPTPGQDVLWVSPLARWHDGCPIRGGVPVCWPWFGPVSTVLNPEQQRLPNHGLVRTRMWSVQQQTVTAEVTQLTLSILVADLPIGIANVHSAAAELSLTVTLTATDLTMALTCSSPLLQQAALHSYFAVTALEQVHVTGIGQSYLDKVLANQLLSESTPVTFTQEIDRVYTAPAPVLHLDTGQHHLAIAQTGFDSTVVWNPFASRCAAIADLADDNYKEFVCVETARLQLEHAAPLALSQKIAKQIS